MPLLAEVAVPVPLAHAFTYAVPAELAARAVPGARVLCNFGRRQAIGVVLSAGERDVPTHIKKLVPIASVLDERTFAIRENSLGPDGTPLGRGPLREGGVMTVEECSRLIVRATMKREREVVMTLRGKVGRWLKLIAPGLIDRVATETIRRGR